MSVGVTRAETNECIPIFPKKKTKFRLLFKAIADLLQTDITDKADFLSLKDFLLDQSHISHVSQ